MVHQKKTILRSALISLVLAVGPTAILSSPIPAPAAEGGIPVVGGLLGGGSSGASSPARRDVLPSLGGSAPIGNDIGTDPSTFLNPGANNNDEFGNGSGNGNGDYHGFKKIKVRALHAIPSPSPNPSPKAKRQSESGSNYNTDGFIDTGFEDGPGFKMALTDSESHYDKTTPPPPPPVVVEQLPPPPPAPAPAPPAPAPAPPAPAPPAPECGCEEHEPEPEPVQYKKRDISSNSSIWKRLAHPQGGPIGGLTGGLSVVDGLLGGGQQQPPIPSRSPHIDEDEKKDRDEERKEEEEKAAEKLAEKQREFEEEMQGYAEKA
ncbi:hypothetical protein VTN00DRAFT_6030 [Thermoascus crustaceus]|uniref:uncharacterized protein n=1 Tax=Thermoascus crustaceus TaxID=5088 RepID=UPI00374241A2